MAIDQRAIVIAHGVLASLAWVIFFPLGSILLRVLDGRSTWKIHALVQTFSMAVFTGAVGTGLQMAKRFRLLTNHHTIIGLLIFALMFTQSLSGLLHHLFFQRLRRRTVVSHVHVWLGRALITLGMINGGLGLDLLRAPRATVRAAVTAYAVVAGLVWALWIALSFVVEWTRSRGTGTGSESETSDGPAVEKPGPAPESHARSGNRWIARQRRLEERRARDAPRPPPQVLVRDRPRTARPGPGLRDEEKRVPREYVIANAHDAGR